MPLVEFNEACTTVRPPRKIKAREFTDQGRFPIIDQSQNDIAGYTNDESACVDAGEGMVIFGDHTCVVKHVTGKFVQGADGVKILKTAPSLDPKFLYYQMLTNPLEHDGYRRHFSLLKRTTISIPAMEIQRYISQALEDEQELVNANRQLIQLMEAKIKTVVDRIWQE